jgi:hypothetical protein
MIDAPPSPNPVQKDEQEWPDTEEVSQERICLRCSEKFPSTWAGERVCARCKSSSAWKQGSPVSVHGSGGGRR